MIRAGDQADILKRTMLVLKQLIFLAVFELALAAQPLTIQVAATSQILLAGAAAGFGITPPAGTPGADIAPSNSPSLVQLALTPGQALQFSASGQIKLDQGPTTPLNTVGPEGSLERSAYTRSSLCRDCVGNVWGRRGALVGVFMGTTNLGSNLTADFFSAAQSLTVQQPVTGQPFLIGS